jgi:hypothetical protein
MKKEKEGMKAEGSKGGMGKKMPKGGKKPNAFGKGMNSPTKEF